MILRLAKFALEPIAKGLQETLQTLLAGKGIEFSRDPEFVQRDIIEFDSRMRVAGMEKFNGPCYITGVNLYQSEQDKKNNNSHGAVLFYIEAEAADKFFKKLGYKVKSQEEEAYLENAALFCNLAMDAFKPALVTMGISTLAFSEPIKALNDIAEGVDFHYGEYNYYEIGIYTFKQKMLVATITLAPVPLR
jgi:hypothetical protein